MCSSTAWPAFTVARVEVGQLAPDLEVAGVDVRHLACSTSPASRGLAALDVLVDDDLVLALGLHHEALLRVQVRQAAGTGSSEDASSLLICFQMAIGLEQEAVARVEVGDLRVFADRLAVPVQLARRGPRSS